MTTSLLGVLVLFCAAVGFGLGVNHANAWVIVTCTIAAIVALQVTYVVALILVE